VGEAVTIMVILLGIPLILMGIFRTYLSHQRFMKVVNLKAEMNKRLLDKLGTEPSVPDILQSDAQRDVFRVDLPDLAPSRMPAPYARMLTAAQVGLVLATAGGGMLYVRQYIQGTGDQEAALIFGTLLLTLGLGSLLAALAAFGFARVWGNGQSADADART
jgi:hypothetical protein